MLSSCSGDPSKGKEGEVPAVGSVAGGGRLVLNLVSVCQVLCIMYYKLFMPYLYAKFINMVLKEGATRKL